MKQESFSLKKRKGIWYIIKSFSGRNINNYIWLSFKGSRTQDRFLILFNDILWVFKEKWVGQENSLRSNYWMYEMIDFWHMNSINFYRSTKTFTPKHRIRVCEIWVATCIYDVSSTMPPPDNSFVLGWPVTNVVATFRTAELKERWLNKLNKFVFSHFLNYIDIHWNYSFFIQKQNA